MKNPLTRLTRLTVALTVSAGLLATERASAVSAVPETVGLGSATKLVGEGGGQAGFRTLGVGDLDRDGFQDLAVGAWSDDDAAADAGAVYVVYGPVRSGMSLVDADAKLLGEAAGAFAGETMAGPADVNGDGYDDLVMGAPAPIPGQEGDLRPGRTYVVYGGPARLSGTHPLPEAADAFFSGEVPVDNVSLNLDAGDLDNDGFDDLVIGGAGWGGLVGKVWIVYGRSNRFAGEVPLATSAAAQFVGEHPGSATGFSVASGDLDGDQFGDLVIGAQSWGDLRGAAYVVYGSEARFSGLQPLAVAGVRLAGEESGDIAGTSVAVGDLDGDEVQDLVVGAPAAAPPASLTRAGAAHVFYGGTRLAPTASLASAHLTLVGETAGDLAGSVAVLEALGDDGLARLAVGAPGHDGGGLDAGAVYVTGVTWHDRRINGRVSLGGAERQFRGEAPGDRAGRSPVATLDANGDRRTDLLFGAEGNDQGGTDAGAAYLVFGQRKPPKAHKVADFDGDGITDISVFRPASGTWFLRQAWDEPPVAFGAGADVPVPADYDGDLVTDEAIFRPPVGLWATSTGLRLTYGIDGDIPVPADYDGDGKADVAVYRPSAGTWYVRPSTGVADIATLFGGATGDVPVPADYDGDGRTDLGIFRSGTWYLRLTSLVTRFEDADITTAFGTSGDVPVLGDYDGDAKTDIAIYRPSTGLWAVRHSLDGTDAVATFGGVGGDVPVSGDYDGDERTDLAIFRSSVGGWFIDPSSAGTGDVAVTYGIPGDIPLPIPAATRLTMS